MPDRQDSDRFRHLPPAVRLEDTITSQDTTTPPDPAGGRDNDREFPSRYA
ncbi:hypothetical protein [Hoyosella subflava]|uniref:Uncharacterized protein n=1 Tax=Hoyosella subflava (strain DSM 45089 / JCM 17490 / NBRC 109087 / DQS3-9A1) TaxID=443218 RepID=F6EGH6_HOYSD|nr:hypothetical protein [Hoyosella subflava]AEF41029.1 hypothetical protein AS9A_2582 [Hoyosella subflava DQS3-9A1]